MNYSEYKKIKNYNYEKYCDYLNEKYGLVPDNYFTEGFTPITKIKRVEEGLYIHHIKEDTAANLSDIETAKANLFEYQTKENLVYANLLEHILLHILIGEQNKGLGFGGAKLMIAQANDFYNAYDGEKESPIAEGEEVLEELKDRCRNGISAYDTLLQHNNTLFYDLDNTLTDSDRALVVLGTGLGKTTTALAYLRKYGYKAIVLCPNNTIVQGWEKEPEVNAITYQRFMNSYKDEDYSKYQVLICDEAHHCTAARWGEGIRYVLEKGLLKVIGLTATPKEKKEKDKYESTVTFFNHKVCQGFTVLDGIERGIIHDFSYVGAIYDTSDIREKYSDISDKKLLGELDLALNNTPTMEEIFRKHMPTSKRKGIIFCSNIAAMDEAEDIMKRIYPDATYRRMHSLMGADAEESREWFKATDEGWLLAVNMISEGAHYKGVNTIVMFRRTQSSLVFNQQLGRIITLVRDEDPEAIVFDLVNNSENIEEGSRFATSLKESYHTRKERGGKIKSEQIIVEDYAEDISTILRRLNRSWSEQELDILRNYYQNNQDTRIDLQPLLSLLPKRSRKQIICQAAYLGLSSNPRKLWTQQEKEIITKFFPIGGVQECLRQLPSKTRGSIIGMAYTLGIKMNNSHQNQHGSGHKRVLCIETSIIYNSIADATRSTGINNISRACSTKTRAGGYHWKFVE